MAHSISDQKSRLQSLMQSYEELLGDVKSQDNSSTDEQSILDRISQKFDEIRTRLDALENMSGSDGNQGSSDAEIQNRKAGRLGMLKDMRSSIAGLMTSLKSAR